MTVAELALLIGASPSSVYRWEAACTQSIEPDGGARRLLELMAETPPRRTTSRVASALRRHGWRKALLELLAAGGPA